MPNPVPVPDGWTLVGRGRTAEVWSCGDGTVAKVFVADRPAAWVDAEAEVTAAVSSLEHRGYVMPRLRGRLDVGQRQAVVLDEVHGSDMLDVLGRRPWTMVSLARRLADVQVAVHEAGPVGAVAVLASLPERMARQIDTVTDLLGSSAEHVRAALDTLVAAAGEDVLCHGDYHPGNVLVDGDDVAVIDWTNAARGPAAMDVAMTTLLLTCAVVPGSGPVRVAMIAGRRLFHSLYRRRLARIRPATAAQVDRWLPVMAAARLADSPPAEHPALLALVARLADRPGADLPGADRPGADRPGADRPGADRPGVDRHGADGC